MIELNCFCEIKAMEKYGLKYSSNSCFQQRNTIHLRLPYCS